MNMTKITIAKEILLCSRNMLEAYETANFNYPADLEHHEETMTTVFIFDDGSKLFFSASVEESD